MRILAIFIFMAINCYAGIVNKNPEVLIPKVDTVPHGNPAHWKMAAKLRIFTTDGKNGYRQVPEATTLYLAHDGKNIYAGWICLDAKGDGAAFPLKPTDDLKLNETVQIVIGLTDGTPKHIKLAMGGYAGAFAKKLNIKYYYEFSANAAGATSRTFNETPLPNPRFIAAVKPLAGKTGFQVIMTIPLASAGALDRQVIYFNAFRFYRSMRYGWYLPHFGGFASMPFGRAVLANAKDNMVCKDEKIPLEKTEESSDSTVPAQLSFVRFTYYPISRNLCAVFPADSKQREAYIKLGAMEKRVKLNNRKATTILLLAPELPPDKAKKAEIGIGSQNKQVTFTPCEKPDWMNGKPGGEYITGRVPFPWTQPEWDGKNVKLNHASINFAESVLPEQITVKKEPILVSPIKLEYRFKGKTAQLVSGQPKKQMSNSDRIDLRSRNEQQVEMRNIVDYDGFMVIRLRFNQADVRNLETLTLTIPLKPGIAKFVNHGHSQNVIRLNQFGYNSNGKNIWVGNQNAGILFSSDRRVWFSDPDDKQITLKKRSDGGFDLKLLLVTAAGQVMDKDQVFQFFLLPTPTRAEMPPLVQRALWFENWSDYQGYPDLKKLPAIRERVKVERKKNKLLYMYFSQVIATNAPGADKFGIEWFAPPFRPWYKRAYNPGKGIPCAVCCFRGAAGELLLNGIKNLVNEGVGGVYLDGPTYPFKCGNPSHLCDDSLPVIFDDNIQHGKIIGQRQFLKRMRGLFDSAGIHYPLWAHTGGGLDLATLSLCDFYYDGEQLARFPRDTMIPQDTFMVAYSGQPFGFRGIFLPQIFNDATGNTPALPWSIVHGIETGWSGNGQDAFFALPRADKTARFYPYYKNQPHIKRLNKTNVAISYYAGVKGAILAAANLHYLGTQDVELDVSGLMKNMNKIEDLTSDEPLKLKNNILCFTVPEGRLRLFCFSFKNPLLVKKIKPMPFTNNPEWQLKHSYPVTEKNSAKWNAKLFSKLFYPQAEALLATDLPKEFTVSFELEHQQRLRIMLNELSIRLDGGYWKLTGSLDKHIRDKYHATGKTVKVQLGVKNGCLTIYYDGHVLLDQVRLENPEAPYRLTVATWGGDQLALTQCQAQSRYTLKPVPIKFLSNPKWQLENSFSPVGKSNSKCEATVYSKPGHPQACAILGTELPGEFTLAFDMKHQSRFKIMLNAFTLQLDGGRWKVSGTQLLDYRGACLIYDGVYNSAGKEIKVQLGVKNGFLTLVYDSHILLDRVRLVTCKAPYRLSICTWGGDQVHLKPCLTELKFILEKPEEKPHPVR